MTLVSPYYWVFLTIVLVCYYNIPSKLRWKFLLLSSIVFYISIAPIFIIFIIYQSLIIFFFCRLIIKVKNKKFKKYTFFIGVFLSLSPLLFFKSIPLWFETYNNLSSNPPIFEKFKLFFPLGISFFTFTGLGYLIDVYNEKLLFVNDFRKIFLFISFFPIVLSGPIERGNFIDQLIKPSYFRVKNLITGFELILWGTFMKLVLADNIDLLIGPILDSPKDQTGMSVLFSILIYPFQVYGDLGGYTLVAIGSAKCLDIDVRKNFNHPFSATSMTDFWRRWHISLIEWINDYIFKPINFYLRNLKKYAIVIALTSTFLIAGIWHKVSLGFIIWGLIQSTILIIEFLFKRKSKSKNIILVVFYKRISTYLMFAFSLIFGGAVANYNDSIIVLKKISSFDSGLMFDLRLLIICIISILVILLKDSFEMRKTLFTIKNKYFSKSIKWSIYYIIILSILFFGVFKNQNFIYFQY